MMGSYKISLGWTIATAIWIGFMLAVTVSLFVPIIKEPAINLICGTSDHTLDIDTVNPYPGETVTSYTDYCMVNGEKEDITFLVIVLTFIIWTAVFMVLCLVGRFFYNRTVA